LRHLPVPHATDVLPRHLVPLAYLFNWPNSLDLLNFKAVLRLEVNAKTFVCAKNAMPLELKPIEARPVFALNCNVVGRLTALYYFRHSHGICQ